MRLEALAIRIEAPSNPRPPRPKAFVIFELHTGAATLFLPISAARIIPLTSSLMRGLSWMPVHWWVVLIAGAAGTAAICRWCLETDKARAQRAQHKQKKELRALADRISTYGHKIHHRYPTGDVVVSECDLAEELRKQPDAVATALTHFLGEGKVQKAPLSGYWKLNV